MGMLKDEFDQCSKGKVETYREGLRRKAPCPDYMMEMMSGSITYHFRKLQGTKQEIDWNRLLVI